MCADHDIDSQSSPRQLVNVSAHAIKFRFPSRDQVSNLGQVRDVLVSLKLALCMLHGLQAALFRDLVYGTDNDTP